MNTIIKITGEITTEASERICEDFLEAERDDVISQIVLLVSSGGGRTDIVPTLYELIKMSNKSVCSIGTSIVCSTASSVFMMPPRRILMPNTRLVLHKTSCSLNGSYTVDELWDILEESKEIDRIFFEPLLEHSKISKNVLYKKTKNNDWVLTDEEIKKYGITTEEYDMEEVRKLLIEA